MSVTHTISTTYSGGGTSPIQVATTDSGEGELNFNQTCSGAGTTTLDPIVIMNPATKVLRYSYQASGNCTLKWDAQSGSDVTIALTANVAQVINGATGLPSGTDTYTLSVLNAAAGTITFDGRHLLN